MTAAHTIDARVYGWLEEDELEDAGLRARCPRILLAEDDSEMRRLLCRSLQADGYDVLEAANGFRLLEYLGFSVASRAAFDVDLIISDIRMPGFTGLEVLTELRRSNWSTPVILITAFGDERTRLEAERLRANLLDKPFDIDRLRDLVRELIPDS